MAASCDGEPQRGGRAVRELGEAGCRDEGHGTPGALKVSQSYGFQRGRGALRTVTAGLVENGRKDFTHTDG